MRARRRSSTEDASGRPRRAGHAAAVGHSARHAAVLGLATLALALTFTPAASAGAATLSPRFGSALIGTAPVQAHSSELALDLATHTLYVANGFNSDGPVEGGDTVSVIDAGDCTAAAVGACKGPWPTITVGDLPSGVAVDESTDTVYVTNFADDTVSIINGATCNAERKEGCGQLPLSVPVGSGPETPFADVANHTVYIPNAAEPGDNTVSMLDSATCNAQELGGCPTSPPPTIALEGTPDYVAANQSTHTAYVTTFGARNGLAAFDTNTCNASTQSGCAATGTLAGGESGPNADAVDPLNDTLYTANYDNTVSAYDLRDCDAADLAGCASVTPGTVTVPGTNGTLYLALDIRLHTAYVSVNGDAALVVIDTDVCNGADAAGCATMKARTLHTEADPQGVVLEPASQTLYAASPLEGDVSVIDALRCSAWIAVGCRRPAPSMAVPEPESIVAEPAVHTAYVAWDQDEEAMIDTSTCNATNAQGCVKPPPLVATAAGPAGVAVDPLTHTLYIADNGSELGASAISVIDTATCNAASQSDCSAATIEVAGGNVESVAVDTATDTIYVSELTESGPNLILVYDGAGCNATVRSGCGEAPRTLAFGETAFPLSFQFLDLALDEATGTLYATNKVAAGAPDDHVYVFDAATCDAKTGSGCAQTPATVLDDAEPLGIAVDESTDTVYVAGNAEGDYPGHLSVIDGASCNGTEMAGCGQTPAQVPAGFSPVGVAVDRAADEVFVTDDEQTSVTEIDGAMCNGSNVEGCSQARYEEAVGNGPLAIAVDESAHTAYVANSERTVSAIPTRDGAQG